MRKVSGLILAAALTLAPMAAGADGLWGVSVMLHAKNWIDLTHPFDADIPHWKGFDPMTRKVVYDDEKDGSRAEMFCHVGQWIRRRISTRAPACRRPAPSSRSPGRPSGTAPAFPRASSRSCLRLRGLMLLARLA